MTPRGGGRVLVDLNVAMEGNDKMGDAHWLDNGKDDRATDSIASVVLFVRFVGADMEVGKVTVPAAYGEVDGRQVEARKEVGTR